MTVTSTWTTQELAARIEVPADEVRRRLFTLGIWEAGPDRYPLKALAALRAQQDGKALCKRCMRTGDTEGRCECKGYRKFLPEPEPAQ